MPTITPTMAAATAARIMATVRRRTGDGTASARKVVATMPVKAPTDMKPAWPRDSSPRIPTVRFRETAMTI